MELEHYELSSQSEITRLRAELEAVKALAAHYAHEALVQKETIEQLEAALIEVEAVLEDNGLTDEFPETYRIVTSSIHKLDKPFHAIHKQLAAHEATILERIGEPVAWSHNNGHIQCDGVGVPSHLYTVENGWTPLFAIKGVE